MAGWTTYKESIHIPDSTTEDAGGNLVINFQQLADGAPHVSTSDPGSSDDSSLTKNFFPGSLWFNTTSQVMWVCISAASMSAVWQPFYKRASGAIILCPSAASGNRGLQLEGSGNTRGTDAVDLQTKRSSSSQVASGNLSFIAGGKNNTASGYASHVEGGVNIASSQYAHAEGSGNSATGPYAHAEGAGTVASDTAAHAEGTGSTASSYGSHAEGTGTHASGLMSHAEGYTSTAAGSYSHAEGNHATASGSTSHSEGKETIANASYSHAEGLSTTASGGAAHAEGDTTVASWAVAHVEGYFSIASGFFAHAEGDRGTASGYFSHAEGAVATASGRCGHAEGAYTLASGAYAHAEGLRSQATASYCHSGGRLSKAQLFGQWARASGGHSSALGTAQTTITHLFRRTSDGSATELTLDGNAPSSSNRLSIVGGQTLSCFINIVGRLESGGANDNGSFLRQVCICNSGTAQLVGSVQSVGTDINPDNWGSGSPISITADTTYNYLKIQVTSAANIRWMATVFASEAADAALM